MLNLDIAQGIPKQFSEVKIVYSEFKGGIAYGEKAPEVGPCKVRSHPDNKKIKRTIIGSYNEMREVRLDPDVQYIIEL